MQPNLQNPEYWVGKTALQILQAVKGCGGWARVFPRTGKSFPNWASRVRNYFNERPERLRLLRFRKADVANEFGAAALLALSGDVYEDECGRTSYEMSTGGTGYHYGEFGKPGVGKAVVTAILSQKVIPVFKLISPDGTGGSMELCIHNWQLPTEVLGHYVGDYGKRKIGAENEWVNVRTKVVISEEYRGSYNYSETTIHGARRARLPRHLATRCAGWPVLESQPPLYASTKILPRESFLLNLGFCTLHGNRDFQELMEFPRPCAACGQ
jgi:hypothetical protein